MGHFVFDKEIFRKKFIQGSELRNRGKSNYEKSESIYPAGSDNSAEFSKVSEEELLTGLIQSVMGEKIDTKKIAGTDDELITMIEKKVKIQGSELRKVFRNIMEDFYIKQSQSLSFGNSSLCLLRYKDVGKKKDLGKFAGDVLLYDETRDKIREAIIRVSNPLDDIMNLAYEELNIMRPDSRGKEYSRMYRNELDEFFGMVNMDIQKTFHRQDGWMQEFTFLLSYYLFVYLSQLALRLDRDFEGTNTTEQMFLMFKMGKESVSKDRDCIVKGWKRVEKKTKNIFVHFILLNMLNGHDNTTPYFGYSDLYRLYESDITERHAMDSAVNYLIWEYTVNYKHLSQQGDYLDFQEIEYPVGNEGEADFYKKKIQYLFRCIEFQLHAKQARTTVLNNVCSNYEHLMKIRFVKSWGNMGKMAMISNDELFLMIKICQRSSERMNQELGIQINDLFYEFERRGLFFDKKSKKYIIDHLHEIHLIDSKCDSEEAQYVKWIQS